MIAHVAGVPVEELLLLVLASGPGAGLLLARAWLSTTGRRPEVEVRPEETDVRP
jgi:hypothetical protein